MSHRLAQDMLAAIVHRAHEFTLPALLDALEAAGVYEQQIEFRSHYTHGHEAHLVQRVEHQLASGRVVVWLNIGLLAAQSPLPSYLFRMMEDGRHDTDAMIAFLAILDQPLLHERAGSEYPERAPSIWPSWDYDKSLLVRLMGIQSPSSLHWLFQRVYPELAVAVERQVRDQTLVTRQVLLGDTALGDSRALGGQVALAAGAMAVTLFCEEPQSMSGVPWAREASRRFGDHIKPLLEEQKLFLDVWLVFFDSQTTAHLALDRQLPDSFLGYDPLGEAPPEVQKQHPRVLQRVLLYSGHTDAP